MNEAKPRKSIFGYILPYLLMAIAIFAFVWLIISMQGKPEVWYLSGNPVAGNDLDTNLNSYVIKTATSSSGYQTTKVSGIYHDPAKNKEGSYEVMIPNELFHNSFAVVGETDDHPSYSSMFKAEIEEYNTLFPNADNGAFFVDSDAFEVSWWQNWGPTILLLGGVVIVSLFFFSRLNNSVNSSNSKAMDFNRSRARREDSTKVRFSDVAGCDEEKAEMVEI
ncbi:MAG: hypothetical protein WC160_02005, partial [Bacilli bacterium]